MGRIGVSLQNTMDWVQKMHLKRYQIRCAKEALEDYQNPEPITKEEEKRIEKIWGKFGFSGNTDWHRLYKNANEFDERYVPTDIYGSELISVLNNNKMIPAYEDKSIYQRLFLNIRKPHTFGYRIAGMFYDEMYKNISVDRVAELTTDVMLNQGKVLVKPSDGLEGRGVEIWKKEEFGNCYTEIKSRLLEYSKNYVIQEVIEQHEVLGKLNNSSVNPIRIMTLRINGSIVYLHSTVRFGMPGKITDVSFENGKELVQIASVDSKGVIGQKYYLANGKAKLFSCTGITDELVIPNFEKVIKLGINIHEGLPYFDLVGSDITVDQYGEPMMIEFNVFWPGITFPQLCNGPLFGQYTDEILHSIYQKKHRK